MLNLFRRFFFWCVRGILSLRYRVRVKGLDEVRQLASRSPGRTVVLPNHPALADPMIVFSTLWPILRMRPLVYEGNFKNPVMYLLGKILNVLLVPAMDQASASARSQAETSVKAIIDGLERNENFILWPSGRLRRGPVEVLGGVRALTDILKAVPDARIVLVRTRGLWGSRFGHAYTGTDPKLFSNIFAGLGWCLASLIFFLPRRNVDITIEVLDRSKLPELRRETINPWFEAWYNTGGPEKPIYVPYHLFLPPRTHEFPKLKGMGEVDLTQIKPETKNDVAGILAKKLKREPDERMETADTTLDELGLDSLDRMEINRTVEIRFGFSSDKVPANVAQLWALAQGLVEKAPPKPAPPEWFRPPSDDRPAHVPGDTFVEAFVARALANRRDVVVADDMAGVLTYERMLVGMLTMSKRLAELPGANIGLLLPASPACDIAFLGLHLAGKLPVILNWTTGPANLEHAARIMELSHVVTSRAFIDRTSIEVKGTKYLFLEDVRAGMGKWELLCTLLTVRWFPGRVRRRVPRVDPNKPAVVLFTSGSEKAPKAVPLTHSNVLTNQKTGLTFLGLTRKDSFLGFLPAFHSFGMSVTGLMPLVAGLRVVRHPDPTDAGGLVRKIDAYKPTILVGTPTFVSYILDRAKKGQLDSLRLIIVGAEKCPQAVFDRCAEIAPTSLLLEGYGITECSPVVSVNSPTYNRPGTIGKPLPGVELCVIDLSPADSDGLARFATNRLLGPDQQGMLLVSGPTIFPGYIGPDTASPFIERDGKRWYVTGDLASIDKDGYIHFAGRLKRFLKIGGEMVSLPALEEPLAQKFPPTDKGPRVAVEGLEGEGKRKVVLFTTLAITLSQANEILEAAGFHGIMRLDEVRQLPAIPVLGTGKTDYKVLRAKINLD
jgi:acyl-CoA synthetase (AMP-forming)/AMP-acid ligase II/1-acyl-sn-glycerol-3-phosphate acyltransferase/acyl carrier protein